MSSFNPSRICRSLLLTFLWLFGLPPDIHSQEIKSNYQAIIDRLFDTSKACQIEGVYVHLKKARKINFKAEKKEDLKMLRIFFLDNTPEFLGLWDEEKMPPSMHASYLDFTWIGHNGEKIGHANLIRGDTLVINHKHIYKLDDVTLLTCASSLADPRIFGRKTNEKNEPHEKK